MKESLGTGPESPGFKDSLGTHPESPGIKERQSLMMSNKRGNTACGKVLPGPLLPSRSPIHCIGKKKQKIPANVNAVYTENAGYWQIPQL